MDQQVFLCSRTVHTLNSTGPFLQLLSRRSLLSLAMAPGANSTNYPGGEEPSDIIEISDSEDVPAGSGGCTKPLMVATGVQGHLDAISQVALVDYGEFADAIALHRNLSDWALVSPVPWQRQLMRR